MSNKLYCYIVASVFLVVSVGLTTVAIDGAVNGNPFYAIASAGIAVIFGIAAVDIYKEGRRQDDDHNLDDPTEPYDL